MYGDFTNVMKLSHLKLTYILLGAFALIFAFSNFYHSFSTPAVVYETRAVPCLHAIHTAQSSGPLEANLDLPNPHFPATLMQVSAPTFIFKYSLVA